ncbi:MAG: L-2-amino-thiazoline-4-carboxylic acid hydrolase [Candidatus Hodarchaeales archaeon]|jgi:hypothetical protein
MDVRKVYNYKDNASYKVNLNEKLPQYVKGLDIFLKSLQKEKPDIYNDYIIALKKKLLTLITNSVGELNTIKIPNFLELLDNYNDLQKVYFAYAFQLLEIPDNYSSEIIELKWLNSDKAQLCPFYYRAYVLCEIMGKDKAIDYLKNYIDTKNYEHTSPNLDLNDVNHFWEEDTREKENPHPSDFIAYRFHKGKIGGRADKCLAHEALKPLNDPELSHIVACYGDTTQIQAQNPNFVLTRTKTLMQGDPYCDTCVHDRRHNSKIKHPNDEFFINLESTLEL